MRSRLTGGERAGLAPRPTRRRTLLAVLAGLGTAVACADDGAGPADLYSLRILDGDGQTGLVGSPLPRPLRIRVRDLSSGQPAAGVTVQWSHVSGSGAQLGAASSATDAGGVATTTLTLGPAEGEYRVVARAERASGSAGFRAFAASLPSLLPLTEGTTAGSDLALNGSGFVPDPAAHVVTFSGVRATVVSVEPDRLTVRVPDCLPSRTVSVIVRVDGRASNAVPLDVSASGTPLGLALGEDLLVSDTELLRCRRLALDSGHAYMIAVQSVATSTAGRHAYTLLGLGPTGDPVAASESSLKDPLPTDPSPMTRPSRRMGAPIAPHPGAATIGVMLGSNAVRAPRPGQTPVVGDTAAFRVLTPGGGLEDVQGVLRVLTGRAELYVDLASPQPGYADDDLMVMGSEFDAFTYPSLEAAFGAPSDLDGSGRIAILFSPAVNRFSPRGSGALVGGFFYAGDLAPQDGSAPAERIYMAVPDPQAEHSDPVDKAFLLAVLPAVLAHEFQHMVHYNERVLIGGADRPEALWLQEAMAQMAEDLVALALESAGIPGRAELFRQGNLDRSQRFLGDVSGTSLTLTGGIGTLAERGAGWLFVRYLFDHLGGEALLGRMTRSALLGSETVVAATGASWPRTFSDWSLALYLDGLTQGLPARFGFPAIDLRAALEGVNDGYRLTPEPVGPDTFVRSGDLRSASTAYYVIEADRSAELALTLSGGVGEPPTVGAGLQARIVRFR